MSTLVMVVLMVAAFWLLLIRPAQKKQKQQQELVNNLGEGSRVMLSSGVFGTIIHNGEKQAIVEVSPGVEMTVLKQAIVRAVEPSEEEFEYDDARVRIYSLKDGATAELKQWLAETEALWSHQLAGFKRHVEGGA